MSLSGNIGTFPLAELLQWFSLTRKSGILTIATRTDSVHLFIDGGILVSADSDAAVRRLGQYLLSRGFITEEQLKRALDSQEKSGKRKLLGNILREHGVLNDRILEQALRQRSEEIVYDLFLLEDGQFAFQQDADFPITALIAELNLSLNQLVLEGMRRLDEWREFRSIFPSDAVRVKLLRPDRIPADRDDTLPGKLVQLLYQERTIGELVMATRRSPYQVYHALYEMVQKKLVEVVAAAAVMDDPPAAEPLDLRREEQCLHRLVKEHRFSEAWTRLEEIRQRIVDPAWCQGRAQWLEEKETGFLYQELPRNSVPRLQLTLAEVRQLDLNPKEGYIISRLKEDMDVRTLCQIMPLSELDLLRVLSTLSKKGVIRLGDYCS
ncbi:MAG: DUF4388 domain-containing protein [Acidobacteria bacterium]|nr:DUF4388 domain-containing protein [Acidobacteriota bacterium]